MYYFSEFTASLNEIEDGIAPTDSRLRPDQHVMEGGDFDEAKRRTVSTLALEWYRSNST